MSNYGNGSVRKDVTHRALHNRRTSPLPTTLGAFYYKEKNIFSIDMRQVVSEQMSKLNHLFNAEKLLCVLTYTSAVNLKKHFTAIIYNYRVVLPGKLPTLRL